jgi:transcriptional regulator with XRE-family HTH domain
MGSAVSDERSGITWSPRLGAHLEAFRRQAGMRRLDLAQRLAVSEETIRLWERGAVQPSEDHLVRLIPMLAIEGSLWQAPPAAPAEAERPELATRLCEERTELGLTRAAVARHLGVAAELYEAWEAGRAEPEARHLTVLASHLGLPEAAVAELAAAPLDVDHQRWPAFGQLVGARRAALRLTRPALAATIGVSPRALMSWEHGYRRPAAAQVLALAEALNLPAQALSDALPRRAAPTRLGELILRRQQELGLRSVDVARLVGTTEPTLSRWINGHSRPVTKNLERLAVALKVPFAHISELATQPTS